MSIKRIVQQNDHIILPKATLMRFMDETKRIYYLDLNNLNEISVKHAYPKSYHSSLNYYNPEYDDKVKQHETAMGELYKKISTAITKHTDLDCYCERMYETLEQSQTEV